MRYYHHYAKGFHQIQFLSFSSSRTTGRKLEDYPHKNLSVEFITIYKFWIRNMDSISNVLYQKYEISNLKGP